MKTGKKMKKGYALALAALLLLPCLGIMQTRAANEIELDRECSLTVSVEIGKTDGGNEEYLEDFNNMSIPVSVYRVADIDVTGQVFTPEAPFEEMDFSSVAGGASSVADDWQTLAAQAEEIREASSPTAAGSAAIQKEEGSSAAAKGTVEGLTPGMYLVVPEASYNPDYSVQYAFIPYLTALPGNAYTQGGTSGDEWIYDTTIGLKPEANEQLGKLNITKTLRDFNETPVEGTTFKEKTTFVFHIVGKDKNGVVKYDEVESMTYTQAGSKTITISDIPAGLTMTVTEIYSGASYTVNGSDTQTAVVQSDAAVSEGITEEATVSFENSYNGGNRGGYGVTNHFESDGAGGWTCDNPTLPAGQ